VMKPFGTLALLSVGLLPVGQSAGAVITWEAVPTPVLSAADIINDGTAATDISFTYDIWGGAGNPPGIDTTLAANGAVNNGPDEAVINGVNFAAAGGSGDFWTDTGDAELDKLLGWHRAIGNATDPWTLVLTGLSQNTEYKI